MRAVQSAKNHLDTLVNEGRLTKEPGKARGYQLPVKIRSNTLAPVVGSVPAGPFNIAVQDIEGYIPVQTSSDENALFALRVKGDSMVDAGILHGDIVLVRHQTDIHPGDIVVAMVDDEATIKEFRRAGEKIQLHPRNDGYPVISLHPENLVILGKVIEVRRYLEGVYLIGKEING